MALIDFDTWRNGFLSPYTRDDTNYMVPIEALRQFQFDGEGDAGLRSFADGENRQVWDQQMRQMYDHIATPDPFGRLRYGASIDGLRMGGTAAGTMTPEPFEMNGRVYNRVGSSYEELTAVPQLAKAVQEIGLRPEDIGYDPDHGYYTTPDKYGPLQKAIGKIVSPDGALDNPLVLMAAMAAMATGAGYLAGGEGLAATGVQEAGHLAGGGLGFEPTAALSPSITGTVVDAPVYDIAAAEGVGLQAPAPVSELTPSMTSGGLLSKVPPGTGSLLSRVFNGEGSTADYLTAGGVGLAGAGAIGALASGGGLGGKTTQTTSSSFPPMSAEERELIALNAELTKRQLAAIDQLQPFQKQMIEAALDELARTSAENKAISGAVSPDELAAYQRDEFERAKRLGPIQDEILEKQLDTIRRNGAATPEQEALIARATDAAIASANADVDASTSRGIGLIADELSNARGLRLSDSPMSGEAALLAREGVVQKGSIEKGLRANQANAQLNYPLAVAELSSKVSQVPLSIADAAKNFQETLRQRAFENRMKLIGTGANTGIGLASTGGGNGALSALTQSRLNSGTSTTTASKGIGLSEIGQAASGIGGLLTGASRLGWLS